MRKILEKLPTEGLLIIVIILISLIVILYRTKVGSVIDSHNKIVITNVTTKKENIAQFVSNGDIEDKIVLEKPTESVEEVPELKRKERLFFIKVDNDGKISLESVFKNIYVGKTPLTKSIERLLMGPDSQDVNRGLLTLIPEEAVLLSITIKDGVAYMNFNEMFRFNSLGVEGYIAQIKQIVYTATEYSSVDSVQILIDGAIQEYLGPEGVYIGRPISRDDLELQL